MSLTKIVRKCSMKYLGSLLFWLTILLLNTPLSSAQTFTATALGDYGNVTVMEVSGNYDAKNPDGTINSAPREAIAKEFYSLHKDEYDFLVIFTNFNFSMPSAEAKAFYTGVKNDIQGIGLETFDSTSYYGSNGKLQGTIDMGNISGHVTNPLAPQFEETLRLLSHEMMHRWGVRVKFKNADGALSSALLGRENTHWSFLVDSQGSLMYGNTWKNNGDGTFTSTASLSDLRYYSPLDLYFMGIYDKSQVPPILLIENATYNGSPVDRTQTPMAGVTISGTARYVTIDEIIAAEGERIPGAATSQKTFKTAFIFITTPNTFKADDVYAIENIRNGAITRFSVQTDGRGIMEVASTPKDGIPANPGVILPPVTPRTLPPDINEGVAWLTNRQQSDGHWEDLSLTAQRDTTETLITLKNFGSAQQNYQNGVTWLASSSIGNTDYLSRTIQTLAGAGQNVSSLSSELVSRQNTDGGWGSRAYYMSNPADTALALLALTAAGYNDPAVIAKTIDYLKATQNPDGGWSAALDQGSTIQPSSAVLSALNIYRSAYPLESAINAGMSWLTQKQNPDGGFGNSPSTVYDTAVAVLALRELAASTVITNNGLGYLKSKQTGTGSWNESAYQTALAVHALWKGEVDPDLSIVSSDITFIPATITSIPATIAINANIWNLGKTGVSQATVALFDGNPALGNKLSEQVMAFPGQSATTVAFSTVVNDETSHTYSVIVDPAGQVNETDELNNTASKTLPVDVAPPTVGFTLASSSGDESAASATLQVSLNKQYYKPVTVDYTINATSTATNAVDYSLTAGTLTFNPGETTKSVELYIINDSLYEANETVVIDLSNPVNATLGQSQHTYTIIDNDILLPVVTIISPLAGETPNKTPLLLYEVSSGTVVVKVDGVVVNKASGDQLASLVDGNHVVQVEATDSYGHTGYGVVSFTVTANGPIDDTVVTEPPYETLFTIPTGTGTAYADEGNKVAVDPDGNVIISRAGYIAKYDSLGVLKWETPAAADTSLKDVATDSCGNVYSNGTATYSTRWDRNAALTKIDTKGAIVAGWPKKWGSIQNDDANGMAVDVSGNPSVTGKTDGPIDGSWNVNYYEHIFLTRFDGSGAMTVNRQYYGNEGKDIVTDSDGNVYIAGRKDFNFFVGKYDSKGNQLWTSTSQPEGVDKAAYVIAIDLNRNLYVSAGGGLVKLDSSGNLMWTRTFQVEPVSSYVYIGDLAVDRSGNVYAAGYTGGSMDGNTNQGLSDLFVVKYDSRGNLVWTRQIGSTGYDHGYGIAIDENDDLYVTANGKLDASGTYKVFLLKFARTGPDPFQPLGTKYYVQSASGCKQTTYSRGTAYAQLGTSKGSCTGPDTTRIRFSGSQNLLIAYAANGGYSKDTLVKGLPEGNALSFLAQDSNGTGLVQLVEVNPSDGTVLRTLSSVSVALTAGRLGYVGDLSTLSGIVQAGKTFGISLSISTDLRSYNQVQWGNAHNCPIGSMQYFTVTETAVETQPPSSTITSPIQGQILGGAYHVISGTAGDGTGSGVISVEVSTDGGVTWGVATDTSGSSSWSSWSYPWVLPADGTYTIRSRAKDLDGNVETPSAGVTITADNTPPSVGISPIKTPTGVSNQTVTGTRESGASIAVTVDTMAVPGTVSYPTATTWSCAITGLIEGANIITVTATDQAGHSSVATATIMYAYSPPPTISLTPADIMDDYQGTVKLVISSLSAPGTEISVEQLIDSNQNGIADIGEPVVRSFKLIDGTASGNPNVQGDEDGLANSSITTMLNYFNVHDRYHAPGAYVFRVSADTGTVGALFAVNAVSRLQTLSGWISDGTNAIPGALVTLVDKWGREIESVTSDHAGHYLFNVREQGDYYTIPIANGYAFDRSTALLVSLSASQATTGHDLTMIPGTYHVTGQVKDAATSAGIGGVWVWAEGSKYVGGVISNTDGSYDLLLPAGTYAVGSPPNSGPDASLKGYVGYNLRKTSVTLTGNVSGIDIAMNRSDILACGRVADDFGSSVPGIMIQGKIPSPVNADEPIAVSVTNDSGDYCLGLYSADKWEISPVTDAAQVSGYIGNMIKSLSTSAGPLTGNNLTVHAINSWIAGSVKNSSNAALKDIDVKIRNTDSSINTSGKTASDGTYRLGVFGGLWYVKAYTEAQGYAPAAEQSVTATDGQSTTVNFTANPVMNNTIVILKAVYTARTKTLLVQASSNNGASAALQLQGYGAMTWNAKLSYWELTVSNVLSAPATVTVVGPEGSKTGNVTIK